MANNNNIPKKTYEQLKDELNRKIREQQESNKKYEYDIRLLIRDMVAVLRTIEKKERAAVTEQIKNDFASHLGRSTIYKYLKEIYEEGLEKPEKQKIAVGADGSQLLEGDESGTGTGGGDDDIYSDRQKSKDNRETRTIKKGSASMQKIKPSVLGESVVEDEEEEQDHEEEQEDVTDVGEIPLVLGESNNIVIEDEDHLREIAEQIKKGNAVVIHVDQHLTVIGISAGKSLID